MTDRQKEILRKSYKKYMRVNLLREYKNKSNEELQKLINDVEEQIVRNEDNREQLRYTIVRLKDKIQSIKYNEDSAIENSMYLEFVEDILRERGATWERRELKKIEVKTSDKKRTPFEQIIMDEGEGFWFRIYYTPTDDCFNVSIGNKQFSMKTFEGKEILQEVFEQYTSDYDEKLLKALNGIVGPIKLYQRKQKEKWDKIFKR